MKNLQYKARNGDTPNFGTDIEFATCAPAKYAFAGSYRNGLQIVDITRPRKARIAAVYDCGVTQGDVQVFRQKDERRRTFVTYTSDTFGDGTSKCYSEAAARGFKVRQENGEGKNGTFIVDVSNPRKPKTVSFVEVPQGSHNQTVHPSGNYLYNSNSDLITSVQPAIEVFDISNPSAPAKVGELSLPPRPGLGTESQNHVLRNGTRPTRGALAGVIIDTRREAEDPHELPRPSASWNEAEPFKLKDQRNVQEFLIVEDEVPDGVRAVSERRCARLDTPVTKSERRSRWDWNIDDVGPPQTGDSVRARVRHTREGQRMTSAYTRRCA